MRARNISRAVMKCEELSRTFGDGWPFPRNQRKA
jgi:hypothetical protein